MRYLLITCIFLWNLSGIATAGPDKDQVLKMLEGRHWKLDIRAFNKLEEDADIILIEIAKNDSLMNVYDSERWRYCPFFLQIILLFFWKTLQRKHSLLWQGGDLKQ